MLLPAFNPASLGLTADKFVYFNGSSFASAAAVGYAATGTLVTVTSQGATDVPLRIVGFSGQSGNLFEMRDASNNLIGRFEDDGSLRLSRLPVSSSGVVVEFTATNGDTVGFNPSSDFGTSRFQSNNNGGMRWISVDQGGNNYRDIVEFVRTHYVYCGAAANPGVVVIGHPSQTANLVEWQNNATAVQYAIGPAGELKTNQTSAGTTLGTVTGKLPVYNAAGTLVGYVPIYDAIT